MSKIHVDWFRCPFRNVNTRRTFHFIPRFSVEVQKGNERLGYIRFMVHTLTQSFSQDCRRRSPPKSCHLLRGVRSLTIQSSRGCPSRKSLSRHKVVWFDASLRHVPSVCPLAKPPLPKIGGRHSANARKLLFPFGASCLDLLRGPSPCSRQDSAGPFSPRSSQNCQNSPEDALSHWSHSASPGIHSTLCRQDRRVDWHVRCFWPDFGLSLAPTHQIDNQCFLHLCLVVGTTNWDVPFHHQFLDFSGSKSVSTGC